MPSLEWYQYGPFLVVVVSCEKKNFAFEHNQGNLVLSTELIIWIGHRKKFNFKADVSSFSPLSERMTMSSDEGLTLETSSLKLCAGQFTLTTQLIILSYPVTLSHRCSTSVSLETNPLTWSAMYDQLTLPIHLV